MFAGIIALYYGVSAYLQHMTSSPLAMLGLYTAFSITGIFTFPVTYVYDILAESKKTSYIWTLVLVIFWLGLAVSAVLSAVTAVLAVPQHLLHPP